MSNPSNYDNDLHMLKQQTVLNLPKLRFLRWLAERGRLEHYAEGASTGAFVAQPNSSIDVVTALA